MTQILVIRAPSTRRASTSATPVSQLASVRAVGQSSVAGVVNLIPEMALSLTGA